MNINSKDYSSFEVHEILDRIYDDFDLKDHYESRVLNDGIVRDYDDVDAINEAARELFRGEYLI